MVRREPTGMARWGGFVGMGGLAGDLFVFIASAGTLPWAAITLLVLLWVVLLFAGMVWFTRRPGLVLALPVIGIVAWLVAVAIETRG